MKKQYGWVSEYKRRKFFESQKMNHEKKLQESFSYDTLSKNNKTIAVMLDLDGTIDFIDDEKIKIFIMQLNYLRIKFGAKQAIISISTHHNNSIRIKEILDLISKHINMYIKIGICFYYGGTYDYDKKIDTFKNGNFNYDKVRTFVSYYVNNHKFDNMWFAIIDDGISKYTYQEFQDIQPMLLARPSQNSFDVLKDNFMSISTLTKGFDGVIELLEKYIKSIEGLTATQVLETQKNMITHLSSFELVNKIWKKDFYFLERYFKEGYADDADYSDTLLFLGQIKKEQLTKDELLCLKRILELISNYVNAQKKEEDIEIVLKLQNFF